jgi:hypothetical protein
MDDRHAPLGILGRHASLRIFGRRSNSEDEEESMALVGAD